MRPQSLEHGNSFFSICFYSLHKYCAYTPVISSYNPTYLKPHGGRNVAGPHSVDVDARLLFRQEVGRASITKVMWNPLDGVYIGGDTAEQKNGTR